MPEFICTVDAAQAATDVGTPPNSVVGVSLSDVGGSFAKTVFTAPDEVKREMLAIALAAISTQSQVDVLVDDSSAVPRQCYSLEIITS
jgi:hypothetical protein